MRIGPFGVWEIMIILIVILLIFGPRRLPEMAKGLGQSVRAFRKEMRGLKDDIDGNEPSPVGSAASGSAPAPAAESTLRRDTAPVSSDASAPKDGGERTSS